jgi:hypothetical protein
MKKQTTIIINSRSKYENVDDEWCESDANR